MAVRFIVGRAGSGKTYHCLQAIRARIEKYPIDGPRLLFLVPEQAGLQMERAILLPSERPASSGVTRSTHRVEVLSFQRLAHRVLDSAGRPPRQSLTEPARVMVLRHLLAELADEFKYYRRAAKAGSSGGRFGGLAEGIATVISEFMQEGIEPGDLCGSEGVEDSGSAGADSIHSAKMHDLRLLYQRYLRYLGTERADPSQYLQIARDNMAKCDWLFGAEMWVDGFASLSGQETLTLIALAKQCHHVDITVMIDPCLVVDGGEETGMSADAGRLFARTCRTYRDLRGRLLRAGVTIEPPELLRVNGNHRFVGAKELERLERCLFTGHAEPLAAGAMPMKIRLVELPSRRVEVDYAVSRICRWVQESGGHLRYRDVAIIVRDLDQYHDILSPALESRDIPFFIDRRCPVTAHPVVELVRALSALVFEDMSLGAVRLALKTDLLPITVSEADELENYLLAHGISGWVDWTRMWSHDDRSGFLSDPGALPTVEEEQFRLRVNDGRRRLVDALGPWFDLAAGAAAPTGREWAAGILDVLERMAVGRSLEAWARDAESCGDPNLADQHCQVWREIMSLIDDLSFALGDIRMTVAELGDVLSCGLSGLSLGLVPPTVDQVLVGSIERSRHPDIKAAVLLGFNDGVFPKRHAEDCILNDVDRTTLQGVGLDLRPPTRQLALDEAMLVYVALTRASDQLVVTYSTADDQGKALRPSPFVKPLLSACPGLGVEAVPDPIRSRATWDVLTHRDLVARLALEFRTRPAPAADDADTRLTWNSLYEQTRDDLRSDYIARFSLSSLADVSDDSLSPEMVQQLHSGPLKMSVSRLETFAVCPFRYFASYALNLRERSEATLAPLDVGSFQHGILEELTNRLIERGAGFQTLDDDELERLIWESHDRIAKRLPGGTASDARNRHILRCSANNLRRIIRAEGRRYGGGHWRPGAAELEFGMRAGAGLPALAIDTPAGRRLLLRGVIDRVDLAESSGELLGVVIDYKKRRDKRLSLAHAYHGLSLQLLTYALAIAKCGEALCGESITPIAALYVSLASQYNTVDHPDRQTERESLRQGTYLPRGLIRADRFDSLDPRNESNWSEHYSVYRKRDGGVGHVNSSDAASPEAFAGMLGHTRLKLGQFADAILDGRVAATPYRLGTESGCSWCPLSCVCRFEIGLNDTRRFVRYARSEILDRVTLEGHDVAD